METRGLVERRECQEDGRGAFVGITPLGQRTIERAAPDHVAAVRRYFIDQLGEDGLAALEQALERLGASQAVVS
jgi:DNA-binding MarR family transcriptional regulator